MRNLSPLATSGTSNQSGYVDFVHYALVCGCRTFDFVVEFNQEALTIKIDLNLPAQRVVRVLNRMAANRRDPRMVRMDNGPEFSSQKLVEWSEKYAGKREFIQPGKPK